MPKQEEYKPTAKGAPLLFHNASTLCNLLKHGPPPAKDLGDAVASLGELLILADSENVPFQSFHFGTQAMEDGGD
jgi:hypothetical protein